ncbi:hypothetical protein BJV78DRAFT_1173334, partial [Lactifluus subvellereus]
MARLRPSRISWPSRISFLLGRAQVWQLHNLGGDGDGVSPPSAFEAVTSSADFASKIGGIENCYATTAVPSCHVDAVTLI